jgi:hypothetical protein
MTQLKHTLLTFAVVGGGFTIAYFVDNLERGMWFPSRLCTLQRANRVQCCPLWALPGRQQFRSSFPDCSTGRQVLSTTPKGSTLLKQFIIVDKGRPEQKSISQPGCACASMLWLPHSRVLVSSHSILLHASWFSLTGL